MSWTKLNKGDIKKTETSTASIPASQVTGKAKYVPIRPRKEFAPFQRRLSFFFDETGLQLCATSRIGARSKILDVRHIEVDHFSGDSANDEQVCEAITEFVSKYGGWKPRIILVIGGSETVYRSITMPDLRRSELEAAIAFEVNRQIPFPLEGCVYGYQLLFRISGDRGSRLKVGLYAATNDLIERQLSFFTKAGVEVHQVCHSFSAIGELLRRTKDFDEKHGYTVINLGVHRSEIAFFRGSSLEFWHTASLGSSILGDRPTSTQYAFLAESLDGELQTSFDYYSGQFAPTEERHVLVFGDVEHCQALGRILTDDFSTTIRLFPFQDAKIEAPSNVEKLTSSCLQPIAASIADTRLVNLLPKPLQLRRRERNFALTGRAVTAGLALVAVLSWQSYQKQIDNQKTDVQSLEVQLQQIEQSAAYAVLSNLAQRAYSSSSEDIEERSKFHLNLKELSLKTPQAIRLRNLAFDNDGDGGNLTLEGTVSGGDIPPEFVLADYISTLESSALFESVELTKYLRKKSGSGLVLEFKITFVGAS